MGPVGLASEYPIWLWPEGDAIRLWTPDATWLFLEAAFLGDTLKILKAARDARDQFTLDRAFNPLDLGGKLAELLARGDRRPVVRLADRPPDPAREAPAQDLALQTVPFEWLSLGGRPIGERVVVARHVSLDPGGLIAAPEAPIYLLDLWPSGLGHPLADFTPAEAVRTTCGRAACSALVRGTDPADYSALIVFGHGTENTAGADRPLQDECGEPWALPIENGLPFLVVLLACGTDCGNLIKYARRLLDLGAKTVIAPYGRLDAPLAHGFLDSFLPRWLDGERADTALLAARAEDATGWGAKRLVIVGQPGLRRASEPLLEELADEDLAGVSLATGPRRIKAAAVLAARVTLNCFQQRENFGTAERRLHKLLGVVNAGGQPREREFFELYDQVCEELPGRLTQAWLSALLAEMAEKYDHRKMPRYERMREQFAHLEGVIHGKTYHYWNRIHYRYGRFALALDDLVTGLARIGKDQFWPYDDAPLFRSLANLFIEFDLPQAALTVLGKLDDALSLQSQTQDVRDEQYKLKDSLARAHLRNGGDGWMNALVLNERKRKETICEFHGSGDRELAWLLYLHAWGDPSTDDARGTAVAVKRILSGADAVETLREQQENGDYWYLLRAYAAWAWGADDKEAVELLAERCASLVRDALTGEDPGPSGFIVGLLQIRAGAAGAGRLLQWTMAREALCSKRYFLEAAAFDALLGNRAEAEEALKHHWARKRDFPARIESLAKTLKGRGLLDWSDDLAASWVEEARSRTAMEKKILLTDPTPEQLRDAGLLPF